MLDPESSELLALAALEAVDEESIQLADSYAAASAEMEQELIELRNAVNSIPYGDAPLPISGDLKERLFQRLDAEENPLSPKTARSRSTPDGFAVTVADRVWQPHPVPGLTMAMLHLDRETRQMTSLIRCEPGARYPAHTHASVEEIFMLEGDFICDGKTYTSGDYLLSACGSKHEPITTQYGCLFLVRTSIDNRMDE